MSKGSSMARIAVAYLIAVGAGLAWLLWGPATQTLLLDVLIADVIATLVIFAASRMHGNSSFYDAWWSVGPPLMALWWWFEGGGGDPLRFWLMMAIVVAWSIRLTGNWAHSFPGLHHEDWRYAEVRAGAGRFGVLADLVGIHLVPTLQVFAGMLSVYVVATRGSEPVGWLDIVAVVIGVGAVAIETVADWQMHRFVARREPGQVMDQGLWSWSRHPNYFGETSFWFALAVFALAADPGAWWVWAGPAAMVLVFFAFSIPMMEKRSLERRPEYGDVVRRVSVFVPFPPRR